MSEVGENQRRTIYFSGRVQGVGFRYTTRSVAQQFDVTGYVQNLDDGRVLTVVEGKNAEIERFLSRLNEVMKQFIRDVKASHSPATGEFDQFEIRR